MIGLEKRVKTVVIVLVLAVLLPAFARGAGGEKWMLRTGLAGLNSTTSMAASDSGLSHGTDFGGGLTVALEHRLVPWMALELGGVFAGFGAGLAVSVPNGRFGTFGGSVPSYSTSLNLRARGYVPLSGAVNFHVTPEMAANIYLGPMLTYSILGELGMDVSSGNGLRSSSQGLTSSMRTRTQSNNALGLGFQVGVDIPFGQRKWGFHGSLKYLDATHELTDGLKANVKPLIITVGISFRF